MDKAVFRDKFIASGIVRITELRFQLSSYCRMLSGGANSLAQKPGGIVRDPGRVFHHGCSVRSAEEVEEMWVLNCNDSEGLSMFKSLDFMLRAWRTIKAF